MNRSDFFIVVVLILGLRLLTSCAQPILDNEYGTSSRTINNYSSDYTAIVKEAFPEYGTDKLRAHLLRIHTMYVTKPDPKKDDVLSSLEKSLALPARQVSPTIRQYEGPGIFYRVDQQSGTIYYRKASEETALMTKENAKQSLSAIKRNHMSILGQFGIGKNDIIYSKTAFSMIKSFPNPKYLPNEEPTEPVVHGIMTYVLREIDGIIVDESEAKLISKSPDNLILLSLKWPTFRFHPQLNSFELKDKTVLIKDLSQKIDRIANQNKVNVKMAVVLRPVKFEGEVYFLPGIRVGVRGSPGFLTIFYEDLNVESVQFEKRDRFRFKGSRFKG